MKERGGKRYDLVINSSEDAVNFLRASPIKHIAGAVCGLAGVYSLSKSVEKFREGDKKKGAGLGLLSYVVFSLLRVLEVTAVTNFGRYKRARRSFERHGWNEETVILFSDTECGRHAARIAAIDTGFGSKADDFYKKQGFKRLFG